MRSPIRVLSVPSFVQRAALAVLVTGAVQAAARVIAPQIPGPWLASGSLAVLLVRRHPAQQAIALVAGVLGALSVDLASGVPARVAAPWAAGGLAEVATAAALTARLGGRVATPARMIALIGAAIAAAAAGAAVAGGAARTLGAAGFAPAALWGAAHGAAILGGLAFASSVRVRHAGRWWRAEAVALCAVAAFVIWETFLAGPRERFTLVHPVLVVPVLLAAAAIRFRVRETARLGLALTVAAALGTARGWGQFAGVPSTAAGLLDGLVFVAIVQATGLVLAAALEAARVSAWNAERSAARATRLLREFELFLVHAPLPVYVKDAESRFVAASAALAEVIGRPREWLVGRPFERVWPPELAAQLRREDLSVIAERAPYRGTIEYRGRSYVTVKFPIPTRSGARVGGFLVDVTDRRQAEQAMRLASVGTLASGVAHEVNNPLAVIIANVGYLADELSDPALGAERGRVDDMREAVSETLASAERVQRIVQQLRRLSSGRDDASTPIDPRAALRTALDVVGQRVTARAELVVEQGAVPLVLAAEHDLAQVLVSVLVNAADAIQGRAGRVVVGLRTSPEGWAIVEVTDDGRGMGADELRRVFDPFFSTKDMGTGLGLAVAHAIVTRLGGVLEVASTPGAGTTASVRLPPAAAAAAPPGRHPASAAKPRPACAHSAPDEGACP